MITIKPFSLKKVAIPLVILLLLAFLAYSLAKKPQAPQVTFTTITGTKIQMADLKGKVVLVNFWATDCPGCVKEMPALVKTYETYKDKGLEIIAVTMPYDPPAQVLNYATQKALPFPVMQDGYGEINSAFGGVNLVPTTYIFDKEGNRLQRTIGELNFDKLAALLKKDLP